MKKLHLRIREPRELSYMPHWRLKTSVSVIGLSLALVVFTVGKTVADTSPRQFIQSLGERALAALQKEDSNKEERRSQFHELFSDGFDLEAIARFVLGRYWRVADPAQRTEYVTLFREFVVKTYAARFDSYGGETFEVVKVVPLGTRDTLVNTHFFSAEGGTPFRVDYRVRDTGGSLKVIDVMVEGVSLLVTHRSQFASVVSRDGIEGLISRLRTQIQSADSTAP